MNKKYEIILLLFWVGLSISVMIGSYHLEIGSFRDPGPGLMPFLFGAALLLLSLPIVFKYFYRVQQENDGTKKTALEKRSLWKVGSILGLLFIYAVMLEKLGYLITTSLFLFFVFKIAGSKKWRSVVIASILTVFGTYLFFTFFGINFPEGVLKRR